MIDVYKHTSKTSGKSYIGYSIKGINKRLEEHKYKANSNKYTEWYAKIGEEK